MAIGRGADLKTLRAEDPSFEVVGAGDIPDPVDPPFFPNPTIPRPLTKAEIDEYIEMFSLAAFNAVDKAGFDGVELHGANGHLIEQFLRDTSNNRMDEYGGSIENRARFLLEIVEGVSKAIGVERTSVRISPWLDERGMPLYPSSRTLLTPCFPVGLAMKDPVPTFSYAVTELKNRFPGLAYLHAIETRTSIIGELRELKDNESNDFLKAIWSPRPLILAGGFVRNSGIETAAATEGVLVAYGRHYIANVSSLWSGCKQLLNVLSVA